MSKSQPQILPTDRPFWFCLRAQTKREHFAAIGLRKQYQITCFAPRLRMRKLTRRGAVWFVEAMFPGYFFAQFDYVTERRRVEHAAGVRSFFVTIGPKVCPRGLGTPSFELGSLAGLRQSTGQPLGRTLL